MYDEWLTFEENAELGYVSLYDEIAKIWFDMSIQPEVPEPVFDHRGDLVEGLLDYPAGEIYVEDGRDKVDRATTPLNWIAA